MAVTTLEVFPLLKSRQMFIELTVKME